MIRAKKEQALGCKLKSILGEAWNVVKKMEAIFFFVSVGEYINIFCFSFNYVF